MSNTLSCYSCHTSVMQIRVFQSWYKHCKVVDVIVTRNESQHNTNIHKQYSTLLYCTQTKLLQLTVNQTYQYRGTCLSQKSRVSVCMKFSKIRT